MSNIDKQSLREAAEKATALNLDTAQVKRGNDGYLECPCCEGAGYVEEESDFCNIDGVALGVQFYGIGEHYGLAESYLRAANPATVLALLDEIEAAEKQILKLEKLADAESVGADKAAASCVEWMKRCHDAEKRIAELEAREVVPDEMTPKQASRSYCGEVRGYRDGWNACRAAILHGDEPVTDNTNQQFESLSRGDK